MKTIVNQIVKLALVSAVGILTMSCTKEDSEIGMSGSVLSVENDGVSSVQMNNLKSLLLDTSTATSIEIANIKIARDEEKLAHDVYVALNATWNNQVFQRISMSEAKHYNALNALLVSVGVSDTSTLAAGEFSNPAIKVLYDSLVQKGKTSLNDAFIVGATIEELDIKDLSSFLQATTNTNINLVYSNLLRGSRNHLRAFVRQLKNAGIDYSPVYLSSSEFASIITSPVEKGNQYKMGNGNGKGKGNGQGKGKKGQGNGQGQGQGNGQGNGSCNQ